MICPSVEGQANVDYDVKIGFQELVWDSLESQIDIGGAKELQRAKRRVRHAALLCDAVVIGSSLRSSSEETLL